MTPTGFSGTITLTCNRCASRFDVHSQSRDADHLRYVTRVFRLTPESLRRPPISLLVLTTWSMLLALLLAGTTFSRRPVHVRVKSACFFALASAAIFLVACGGGSTTPPNVGTQKGTYTLVLTAKSGTLTHTMNLTLNGN
jgi:hypothetical protein